MALRDKLKQTNCFKVITIPEWDTGGEVISVRALTIEEQEAIDAARPEDDSDAKADGRKKTTFVLLTFCFMLGDSAGNRVYPDASEADFKEIRSKIPAKVIQEVIRQAGEFSLEATKKN